MRKRYLRGFLGAVKACSSRLLRCTRPKFLLSGACCHLALCLLLRLFYSLKSTIEVEMLKKILAAVTVISFTTICGMLVMTTPSNAGPLGILLFFVFMYLSALGALTFLFHGGSFVISRVVGVVLGGSRFGPVPFRKSYYYASAAALTPVMLLAMQSVNQIGFYQLLLVIFFVVVAWVYISKRTI